MLFNFPHRVTIKRRTPTQTGLVVNPGTPVMEEKNVPCLIQEDAGAVRPHETTGDRLSYVAICFFPIHVNIQPKKGTNIGDTVIVEVHKTIPVGSEFLCIHAHNPGGVPSLRAQHIEAYLSTP